MDDIKQIGQVLARWRTSQGLTQAAVSARTNIDRQTVSNIERGVFTGSLKILLRYLHAADLHLAATPAPQRYPTLEELAERYRDDDD